MTYDLAVVGGGILGLAHALMGARRGLRVAVFERGAAADGASVRNFGMLAVVAQRPGPELESARATLAVWQEVAAGAGLSLRQAGCLFVARRPEEMAVLAQCAGGAGRAGHDFRLVEGEDLYCHAPGLRRDGVLGGLYSPDAWKVDQRRVLAKISDWLARAHGVVFHFGTEVLAAKEGRVHTDAGDLKARQVIVCGGNEFATLFPQAWRESGVGTCRLQMLRTVPQPDGWRLKPFVLGGLSLTRYSAFADCPDLPALRAFQQAHQAAAVAHGVHVIAAQEDDGSVTLGDSHHYGAGAAPEDARAVDDLILDDLAGMMHLPRPRIARRWVGSYAHLPGCDALTLEPASGVTAVTVTTGQGMTHGFALAARTLRGIFDD